MKETRLAVFILLAITFFVVGCQTTPETITLRDREQVLDEGLVKITFAEDQNPPQPFSDEFELPVAIVGGVNTVGAEDSPFITPDGSTLYFFFTPDVDVPVQEQVLDGVSGLYVSRLEEGIWGRAERILLQDASLLAMDGCPFVLNDRMWFCTVREGYTGIHWFTAEKVNGAWVNWQLADFEPEYQVGELHISSDGTRLYYHSDRTGGQGGLDIWTSTWVDNAWSQPENIGAVNSADNEGWPALNPQGDELWFTRNHFIWRSRWVEGAWSPPEMILGPLAGEPTIDDQGNVFFVHHFFVDGVMIEADIYVAHRIRED